MQLIPNKKPPKKTRRIIRKRATTGEGFVIVFDDEKRRFLRRPAKSAIAKTRSAELSTAKTNILRRVSAWAGGEEQALAWYRSQRIPALGGQTAESLVEAGESKAVIDYLDGVALGGFA